MAISVKLQAALLELGLNPDSIQKLAKDAIAEDLAGGNDLTSNGTIAESQTSRAIFQTRSAGVVSGLHMAAAILEACGILDYEFLVREGASVTANTILMRTHGSTRNLLLAERTALNFLGRLSGISTLTKQWVDAMLGTNTKVRDSRKTTPLLRDLEKFAVRMGGGTNHRMSLSDAALIKDNHISVAGGVAQAFTALSSSVPDDLIEIEVDSLEQLEQALAVGAKFILLDNMSPGKCKEAVTLTAGRAKLEASGGLTLINARTYAQTGVDFLAVGALTHSAPVLDIGLDFEMEK
jgi:nicotinate-nucleotide pyrophosphorylase (carboxylating)